MIEPTILHLFRFTLEAADGREHDTFFYYWARDKPEAREQALAEHGDIFKVDGFGYIEPVVFSDPRAPRLADVEAELRARLPLSRQEWLTVDEAAELVRTSDKTILKMIHEERLTEYRLDAKEGHIRIRRSELPAAMRPSKDQKPDAAAIADRIKADLFGEDE
jgi:excisionase family DNA binding protein